MSISKGSMKLDDIEVRLLANEHDILMLAIARNNYTTVRFLVNEFEIDLSVNNFEAYRAAIALNKKDEFKISDFIKTKLKAAGKLHEFEPTYVMLPGGKIGKISF